jgi:hypothetical protein
MSNSYIDRFKIIETYKKNKHQEIFVGLKQEDSNHIVIINKINSINFQDKNIQHKIRQAFHHLIYLEETNEGMILVTDFIDGLSLSEYFKNTQSTIQNRMNIALEYLKNILQYDNLDNHIKKNLINESQIIMKDNQLFLNDLIVINDSEISKIKFKVIIEQVHKVIKRIFTDNISDKDKENDIYNKISQFIDKLENYPNHYKNLNDIYDSFKGIYIRDGYMTENILRPNFKKLTDSIIKQHKQKFWPVSRWFKFVIFTIVLFIAVSTFYIYSNNKIKNIFNNNDFREPTAYFQKAKLNNNWKFLNQSQAYGGNNAIENSTWTIVKNNTVLGRYKTQDLNFTFKQPGEYKIILKVKDKNNKWSKPFYQMVYINEIDNLKLENDYKKNLNNLPISYNNPKRITVDHQVLKSGKYSIKVSKGNNSTKTIYIKDLKLNKHLSMSMWAMSNSLDDARLIIRGFYNSNSMFRKSIDYKPSEMNIWEMININEKIPRIDQLQIEIYNPTSTIWLNDIEINVYK